jgi:biopolymer transport protein ExbD
MSSSLGKARRRPELNLVPLIDVLVMLIFFAFVTMQFKSAQTLNITLPKISTAGKNELKGNVTIAIGKDGTITFNGQTVSEEQLVAALDKVHNLDADIPVLIKADEASQVKKLAFVMDSCRQAHLNRFSLQSR